MAIESDGYHMTAYAFNFKMAQTSIACGIFELNRLRLSLEPSNNIPSNQIIFEFMAIL